MAEDISSSQRLSQYLFDQPGNIPYRHGRYIATR